LSFQTSLREGGQTRPLRAEYSVERAGSLRVRFWISDEFRGEVRVYLRPVGPASSELNIAVEADSRFAQALDRSVRNEFRRDARIWDTMRLDRTFMAESTNSPLVRAFEAWLYPHEE
jgi:hypothetical protein